ncbi:MAG: hypothetical protein OMOMHJEC_01878 [Xanthomonadales bacterium]|nr:hypothetical protein [Xanthomonadales bacterium]
MNAHRDSGLGIRDRIEVPQPSLTAVIPVGPGDRSWRELVELLAREAPGIVRVLVFAIGDLQSRPRDPAQRVLEVERGRARQLNAGARRARSEWVWFLHADSRPDARTLAGLATFLAAGHDALGYFDLRFHDRDSPLLRLTEWGARWRCRRFGLPFGDQGFVLRRTRFEALGGFDEARSFGEDHALVWAARRAGVAPMPMAAALPTSARKYREHGWLKTTLRHQRLTWSQAWQEWRRG